MVDETTSFKSLVEAERDRLTKARDKLREKMTTLEAEMELVDSELTRIQVFFRDGGELHVGSKKKKGGTRGPRSTGRTASLLALIQNTPDGIKRADILTQMGAKGDKSAENTISTALSNLKKQSKIGLKDGLYTAA